jgi:hypothetical protein
MLTDDNTLTLDEAVERRRKREARIRRRLDRHQRTRRRKANAQAMRAYKTDNAGGKALDYALGGTSVLLAVYVAAHVVVALLR